MSIKDSAAGFDFERFSSTSELLAAVRSRPCNSVFKSRAARGDLGSRRPERGGSFYMSSSFDKGLDLANRGFAEAASKCAVAAERTTAAVNERVAYSPARPRPDYVGGSPHVVRAILGLPRDMRRTVRESRQIKGVSLALDIGASGSVSASRKIWAGARLVALLKLFERDGVPVRLLVTRANLASEDGQRACCEVVVRDFGQPLNMSTLCFWAAHPTAHRRVMWAWTETSPIITDDFWACGYGYSVSNPSYECETARDALRADYLMRGVHWFCLADLSCDSAVVDAYEDIKSGRR